VSELYALTGRPGVGKTTVVMEIVRLLRRSGLRVGGMYTREVRMGSGRVGFEIIDIATERRGVLARVGGAAGPRVGRYVVNLTDLEEVGVRSIRNSLSSCDVTAVDEIGPMELKSVQFRECVDELLKSGRPALLTVHYKADDPLVVEVRKRAGRNLYTVTEENRNTLPEHISSTLIKSMKGAG